MSDVLLSFLSLQDQKMLMTGDLLNFGLFLFVFYSFTKKEVIPNLPEDESKKEVLFLFRILIYISVILIILVFISNLVVMTGFIPCIFNETTNQTNSNLFILIFYLVCIFRITFLLGSVFFISYFFNFKKLFSSKRQLIWMVLLVSSLLINIICLFYFLIPNIKNSLVLYQGFYEIRNLFVQKDSKKQKKISAILNTMREYYGGSIPSSLLSIYERQWACTFKNQVRFL